MLPPQDFRPDIFGDIVEKYKSEVERGWRILMIGIVVEVVAALGISVISGLEIADLTDKSDIANLEAKQAEKDAIGLKAEVLRLESRTKGRVIDDKIKDELIGKLHSYSPKGHVEVVMFQYDHEAVVFGRSITNALIEAGFDITFSPRTIFNMNKEGVMFCWKNENSGAPPPPYADIIALTLATSGVKVIDAAYNDTLNTNDIQIFIGAQPSNPQ